MSWLKKLFRDAPAEQPTQLTSIMEIVDREREVYQGVLQQLFADLSSKGYEYFPEIQIKLNGDAPEQFRRNRIDAFFKDGERVGPAEANLKNPTLFRPITESWGDLQVTAQPLVWNSIEFIVTGPPPKDDAFADWLGRWYDAEDTNPPDEQGLHGVVHSIIEPVRSGDTWETSVDFGSSGLEAFNEFIELVRATGAKRLRIGSFSYGPASAA